MSGRGCRSAPDQEGRAQGDAAPGYSQFVAIWGRIEGSKSAARAEGSGRGAVMAVVRIEMGSLTGATLHGLTLIGDGDGVRPVSVRRLEQG